MSLQDLHNNLMLNSINDHIQEHTKEKYPKGDQSIGTSSNENQPGELKQICKCCCKYICPCVLFIAINMGSVYLGWTLSNMYEEYEDSSLSI